MNTLQLNNSISKCYCLLDKHYKTYIRSCVDNGKFKNKELYLQTIPDGQINAINAINTIYTITLDQAIDILNIVRTAGLINIRIFIDSVEITDSSRKAEILENFNVFEYKTESTVSLRSLTDQAVKLAKDEDALRIQVNNMIKSVTQNMSKLPISKVKKLKAALTEI